MMDEESDNFSVPNAQENRFLTTDIFSVKSTLANLIDLASVINTTSRCGFLAGNPLVLGTLHIDVGTEVLVQVKEPIPDLVRLNAITVQVLLDKDVSDGCQLHPNDLGQVKVLFSPAYEDGLLSRNSNNFNVTLLAESSPGFDPMEVILLVL